jgi:polysaccharide export outer membrane protein
VKAGSVRSQGISITPIPRPDGVAVTRFAVVFVLAILFIAGCGTRKPLPPPPEPDPMARDDYRLGVSDILRIDVWRNPELSIEIPVRPDGKISVPLLDDVQAEGLTPTELKEILTRELAEFITAPNVTVIVIQMNSRFVSVLGEVNREGRVPLTRNLRVLEAIAFSAGFNAFADKDNIRIVRRNTDGTESEYRFDYDAYRKGKAPGTNIILVAGDTIIVPD